MNRAKSFSPLLFLLAALCGCFSAEQKQESKQAAVYPSAIDQAPAVRTPEEALRQLLEANSRSAHGENRWLSPQSSKSTAKPFALVINASTGDLASEEIFDLPQGAIHVLPWKEAQTDWVRLENSVQSGVKLVLVILPYQPSGLPEKMMTANAAKTNLVD